MGTSYSLIYCFGKEWNCDLVFTEELLQLLVNCVYKMGIKFKDVLGIPY